MLFISVFQMLCSPILPSIPALHNLNVVVVVVVVLAHQRVGSWLPSRPTPHPHVPSEPLLLPFPPSPPDSKRCLCTFVHFKFELCPWHSSSTARRSTAQLGVLQSGCYTYPKPRPSPTENPLPVAPSFILHPRLAAKFVLRFVSFGFSFFRLFLALAQLQRYSVFFFLSFSFYVLPVVLFFFLHFYHPPHAMLAPD